METEVATVRKDKPLSTYPAVVKIWLIIGLVMIFFQVVIGGVTRLTGSGLSITKWEIVTGTFPPLNAQQWDEAFDLYKATPQYQKINDGMSLSEFKFIFFWEYFHRLWARSMGFVFIIPLMLFWRKKWIDPPLLKRLGMVFFIAAVVASFGWIMVASGLNNRPWVNAYKLSMHLSLAFILYSYLLWTIFTVVSPASKVINNKMLKTGAYWILSFLSLQIILGGIVSGMKAGLFYPTWPDMNGEWFPAILFDSAQWHVGNFVQYDAGPFMAALIQVLHRSTAYVLTIMILAYFFKAIRLPTSAQFKLGLYLLVSMLIIQLLLGIFTLINALGTIPVGLGVMHQAGALVLLSIILFLLFQLRSVKNYENVENYVEKL
ncbi:MAG: COX15/CtaA family protein [Saprospiraceae bacterium]